MYVCSLHSRILINFWCYLVSEIYIKLSIEFNFDLRVSDIKYGPTLR
jgi:hypothetical protein